MTVRNQCKEDTGNSKKQEDPGTQGKPDKTDKETGKPDKADKAVPPGQLKEKKK